MKKLYSIIVPLYNTEKYISECVESVINQTYTQWELIIINDGSTDKSLDIVQEYAKNDKRIKIINQENKGVSEARNKGIANSTGDYIFFLDSDDYMNKNLLKEISRFNDDFICFGYTKCFVNRNINVVNSDIKISSKEELLKNINTSDYVGGFLWEKAFKRSIIMNNKLEFDKSITFCEDLLFVNEYAKHCKTYKYIDKSLYNYRMRQSSVSFKFINKKNTSILEAYRHLIKTYEVYDDITSFIKYRYLFNYYKLKKVVSKEEKVYAKKIKKEERQIFKKIKISKRSYRYYKIVRLSNSLYIILKKYKDKKLKLYE